MGAKQSSGYIYSPVEGDHIGSNVLINGRVQNISSKKELWIAHRRVIGGLIWPKEPKIIPNKKGEFSLTTFEGGAPGNIVVSLLLVDQSTSEKFERWLERGHKSGNYPGIKVKGRNIIELANVKVIYDKKRPLRIFISYSHEDEKSRIVLEKHLSILKHKKLISVWHDRHITAGTDFSDKIDSEIDRADLILILVSASFLASDYCYGKEMTRALQRHHKGEARVLPIIVRAVDWREAPFRNLLALPTDAKPVQSWSNEDEAWADVSSGIRKVIEEL